MSTGSTSLHCMVILSFTYFDTFKDASHDTDVVLFDLYLNKFKYFSI